MTRLERLAYYKRVLLACAEKSAEHVNEAKRRLAKTDLFFLLLWICKRKDINHDWGYARCNEVQAAPNGRLDLWSREHFKSSCITFGLTIQDILNDPEITVGIFSFNRPTAKAFLRQIKIEFETNEQLKTLFPEILWSNAQAQSPKWSEDEGIIVKRKGNPKESTVEAWGLVDAQPTGRHFKLMVYDDVVTRDSVTTPDMIRKVTEAWELSRNLTSVGGFTRYIGTRYHFCLADQTRILMNDWCHKPISAVKTGDTVVGWELRDGKRYLRSALVTACGVHEQEPVNEYMFDCGRSVICTPSHKWWRGPHGSGSEYKVLGLDYAQMGKVRRLLDPLVREESYEAGWLSGFFDGEGTVRKNTHHPSAVIVITQSMHNPGLIDRTRESLTHFGFKWSEHWIEKTDKHAARCNFAINGGWRERYRFLSLIAPYRNERIIQTLFTQLQTDEPKLTAIFQRDPRDVFWIETETGNYIAEGFCSKNSDTYHTILERKAAIPRFHPGTVNGKEDGEPVFWTKEILAEKRREMGPYTFAAQVLQDPTADHKQGFKFDWIRYHDIGGDGRALNKYLLVDPASSKKKESDYTAMGVVGLGADGNYYLLDGIRDRLNLRERGDALFALHRRWRPMGVGYEKYGMQADIEYLKERMNDENYRFDITELGGKVAKPDRIKALVPIFEAGRFIFPETLYKTDYEGKVQDLVQVFIEEEYKAFPVGLHEDFFDMLARIMDEQLNVIWPKPEAVPDRYASASRRRNRPRSFMAA